MKKVILISGGSTGLGYSIAKLLSPKHDVVIASTNEKKLFQAASDLKCQYKVCNISDWEQDEKLLKFVVDKFGRIDVLINNAGIWLPGELSANDPKKIREVIDVNTTGTIYLTKAALPYMKKQARGLIINIISKDALYAKPERSVYHASKWAIRGFTECMETELEKYGIAVTGIYPGLMKTKLFHQLDCRRDLKDALDPDAVAKVIEFILSYNDLATFPDISIRSLKEPPITTLF